MEIAKLEVRKNTYTLNSILLRIEQESAKQTTEIQNIFLSKLQLVNLFILIRSAL